MTIWCPFDTEDSLFVKLFRQRGYTVIATHIANGQDFFAIDPPKCDYIISNPPYSLKGEVFERLFQLNIPFAMLVGVVGLFESQKRFKMFREHDFEIMYLNRRVSYFKNYADRTRLSVVSMYAKECYQSRLSLKKFKKPHNSNKENY